MFIKLIKIFDVAFIRVLQGGLTLRGNAVHINKFGSQHASYHFAMSNILTVPDTDDCTYYNRETGEAYVPPYRMGERM